MSAATETVGSHQGLRAVYRQPAARAAQKVLDHLDEHCRNFIALSPLCVPSSANAEGQADASPRGDPPGFVQVLDERTLPLPGRPGNNQVDSLQNIVENPGVGLLFLVPGMHETLRVKGKARIATDPGLLSR
ncbi:MAG: pyridoxamine 5'-phosphate oxidase family protein [Actinomycetia bacterium]|nr:pyridoxamine 5'-phosphate oxidase family protein [Actinomycetes bacterium]